MNYKKLAQKILFPPVWLMLILTVLSGVALVLVFVKGWMESPVAYFVYVLSFYTLSVICLFCIQVLPGYYKTLKQKVYDNPFGNRYMTDAKYRTRISLNISLIINLLYAAVNLFSGYWYKTAWFACLAAYYMILAVMRFLLIRYVGRYDIGTNLPGEWRRSRGCALILTLVNLSLSGVVLMIMYQDKGFVYPGMLIYVMAAYTFYITVAAIVRLVKYRKYRSPIMSMTKIITLMAALVSMLALETAMLTTFGAEMTFATKRIFIAATGAGISVLVVAMSAYMIVRSTKELKRIQQGANEDA